MDKPYNYDWCYYDEKIKQMQQALKEKNGFV